MEKGTCKQGVYVRNMVNGIQGLVIGKIIWMYGCEKLLIAPKEVNQNIMVFDNYQTRYITSEEYLELTGEESPFEREFVEPNISKWFGMKCRDKVTGLEGICIACSTALFSADQYAIERLNKKQVPVHEWFDEGRLEIIDSGVNVEDVSSSRPGGSYLSLPAFDIPAYI